jgi:hypothetical protein
MQAQFKLPAEFEKWVGLQQPAVIGGGCEHVGASFLEYVCKKFIKIEHFVSEIQLSSPNPLNFFSSHSIGQQVLISSANEFQVGMYCSKARSRRRQSL